MISNIRSHSCYKKGKTFAIVLHHIVPTCSLPFLSYFLEESLDLLKQKDSIIDKLLEGLEELLTKSSNETSSNSNDLDNLNEIANNKLKILKEEHKKYNLAITVSKYIIIIVVQFTLSYSYILINKQ